MAKVLSPFVSEFHGKCNIKSSEFISIFNTYDKDGNGFIDAAEIDNFLKDLTKEKSKQDVNEESLQQVKKEILSKYDSNYDGRISLDEIAKILPTEENFLIRYRDSTKLNAVDFMKIWYHYDEDRSGYLESHELKGFLHDLEQDAQHLIDPQQLESLVNSMLEMFDRDHDGKIGLTELSQLLPIEENFLTNFHQQLSQDDFEKVFQHYDQNNDGFIAENELLAFLRDLVKKEEGGGEVDIQTIEAAKIKIMAITDLDKDGKLSRPELKIMLTGKQKN